MALPDLEKTWYKDLNVEERSSGDGRIDRRRILFNIKDKLCNLPVPWVVAGSSDGSTFGFDGPANGGAVDRWTDYTAASFDDSSMDPGKIGVGWVVLRQAAINPKFEILIQCKAANPAGAGSCCVWISPTQGFGAVNGGTDGSMNNTDPPTASDRIQILGTSDLSGAPWLDGTNASSPGEEDFIFNYWQSDDGECTRIFALDCPNRINSTNVVTHNCLSIILEKPKNPLPEWPNPVIAAWTSKTTELLQYGDWNTSNINVFGNHPDGGAMKIYFTCEGIGVPINFAQGLVSRRRHGLTGKFELYPMGLVTIDQGAAGRLGERYDIWWVSEGLLNGTTIPVTPARTREFRVFNNMLAVWDGTVPVVS